MKSHLFRFAGLLAALLLGSSGTVSADHVVYRGTTVIRWELLNYLDSTQVTNLLRGTRRLQQIGVSSSLGGTGYALYTLDFRQRLAYKSTGNFAKGPTIFPNFNDSGRGFEVHKQFNKKWSEDIPGLGDTEDISLRKTGTFGGPRSLVRLPAAGFSIEAALRLAGYHTEVICSEEFGIDSSAVSGYAAGRFFQVNSSRSTFRLDTRLSDQANELGGSLPNAILVVEEYLILRNFTIVNQPPLPF
jgi:hypothetical protein